MALICEAVDGPAPVFLRPDAIAAGEKRFFDGLPCSRGHVAEKYVSNRTCGTCLKDSVVRHKAENPGWQVAYNAAYHAAHAETLRARSLARYYRNPDVGREANRKWHLENSERHKARCVSWRQENPELKRAHDHNRRARKLASSGRFTPADIRRIYAMQKGKCAYCRVKLGEKFHRDHIIPLALGGSNAASNIQLTCAPCNKKKNAKRPEVFARSLGLLI